MAGFKNALCLDRMPEGVGGYSMGGEPYWSRCQRRKEHGGPHRNKTREWSSGDRESHERWSRSGPVPSNIKLEPEVGGSNPPDAGSASAPAGKPGSGLHPAAPTFSPDSDFTTEEQ